MKDGRKDDADEARRGIGTMKEQQRQLAETLEEVSSEMQNELIRLPNLPHELVAPGKSADDNVVIRSGGSLPDLDAGAVPHWDLIKKYDIIDFDLGIKITGAGFPVYKGQGARLQRALINFFLDEGRNNFV